MENKIITNRLFLIVIILLLAPGILPVSLASQEALKSTEEEYYDFLSLLDLAKRPTLGYRTLSDSVWTVSPGARHPWSGLNLGGSHNWSDRVALRVYGPELFISINTAAPYGYYDGALWQGRGFNTSLTGGARIEAYGFELTFKPQLSFSQNLEFDIMPSAYPNEYGYFWGYGIDAPQRFGNEPFLVYDWGDSELRYTWKTLTIGFGTQTIWLGPAKINPILHSNNAPSYPKFDIGLRRQPVTIPWLNWYIGDFEARLWIGLLTESDYFDTDASNDDTMFHGFSFAYAPSFIPGLVLSANRICLVPWERGNLKYIFPSDDNTYEDQKASFGFSWLFPQVGFEVYGELGIDDYVPGGLPGYIRRPFHTTVYTAGLRKSFKIVPQKQIYGELGFEFNWMEMTQDYQFFSPSSFYFHHLNTHGYTNRGQLLGNAVSPGGNSQFLGFKIYYPRGNTLLFISRNNPDNNYLYAKAIKTSDDELEKYYSAFKANFSLGIDTAYSVSSVFMVKGGLVYHLLINPGYETASDYSNSYLYNFSIRLGLSLKL